MASDSNREKRKIAEDNGGFGSPQRGRQIKKRTVEIEIRRTQRILDLEVTPLIYSMALNCISRMVNAFADLQLARKGSMISSKAS
jgi:hypothetical protein